MKKYNEILLVRIISITLYAFSIIILPALIALSYLLRIKIEQAFNKFGRDETMKLINVRGLSGLLTVILASRRKKVR
jgi:hypothetical protein